MQVKVLAEGIALEWGVPSKELISKVEAVTPFEIRDSDLEELYDALKGLGYTQVEIMQQNFGFLLSRALGLGREGVRTYTLMDTVEDRPLFVATLSRVNNRDGVCILYGYGLTVGYERVTKREIKAAIENLFGQVLRDLRDQFQSTIAVCHVKSTNHQTLLMWKWLARQTFKMYKSDAAYEVKVSIADDPFTIRAYKLVTLSLHRLGE